MTDTAHPDHLHTETAHTDPVDTDHVHAEHDDHGLSDFGYIKVAIFLAVITAIEVGLSYMVDDLGALFLPLLLGLMLLKFFMVILYFMHLKFDSPLLSQIFYSALFVAVAVYIAALATFDVFRGW